MGETNVTKMIIKGDLQCYKCRKKIKNTLCKIPQIRDQIYDEKNNKVTIIVECCSPEKIRDRICSKACGSIESIEIVEEKPPEPSKSKQQEKPKTSEKSKEPEKLKAPPLKPKEPDCGYPPLVFYPVVCCPSYEKFGYGGPCYHGRPSMCSDGCERPVCECHGRPLMCSDGCGRPVCEGHPCVLMDVEDRFVNVMEGHPCVLMDVEDRSMNVKEATEAIM